MTILTNEEKAVVRRGRNAKSRFDPEKYLCTNLSVCTAFEALIGYHYLGENKERLEELLERAINFIREIKITTGRKIEMDEEIINWKKSSD